MCIIFVAYHYHPDYRLIVAANRDEFYSRPTEPAHFWRDQPAVLAGRDLEQMGTWLGITTSGRLAALTNFRNPNENKKNKQSRGHIVRDFLTGQKPPDEFLIELQSKREKYQGFNILISDHTSLFYYSNVENEIKPLKPGLYGLSNHLLDTRWPKVQKGKKQLEQLLKMDKPVDEEDLFRMLRDDEPAPKETLPNTGIGKELEEKLSSIFIKTPDYGTRCSTIIIIDSAGKVRFIERTFPVSENNERRYEFHIRQAR